MTQMSLREGDVLKYEAGKGSCREGLALVHRSPTHLSGVVAVDTYWQKTRTLDSPMDDGHVLSDMEMETASVLFNISDYERLRPRAGEVEPSVAERWERYRPEDRVTITSQHGGHTIYLVRHGAEAPGEAA